jgi:hypothetical protein
MDKAKVRELELRNGFARLFTEPKEGVNHLLTADGFDLVLDYKVNRKLDVAALDAVMNELPEDSAFRQTGVLIEYKPALVMKGYRVLPDAERLIFCQALTETPGTPGLEIKRVKTAAEDPATAPAPGANHFFSFPAALPQAEAAFRPNVDLIHAAFGMAGESGELVDLVKKSMFYGKPLKPAEAIKEAEDCLWYIAGPFCRAFGITLEQLAALNVAKLRERYPDKYSDQAAVERKDVEGAN